MALAGAIIGALVAFMFLTPQGRALRRRVEPFLEDLVNELDSFRGTYTKVSTAANDSWKMLH
jgi:hypothetical protein